MKQIDQSTIDDNKQIITSLILALSQDENLSNRQIWNIFRKHPRQAGGFFSKASLRHAYHLLKHQEQLTLTHQQENTLLRNTQKKKTRSISGVTPVTILTKPFPCPGKCIFCPNDVRMPKSYLSAEPGAQRATRNNFDPYAQTYNRLLAFKNTGHPTDKIELIVLGGTWTSYLLEYQIWFIKRCFDALNDFNPLTAGQPVSSNDYQMPFEESELRNINGIDIQDQTKNIRDRTYNASVSMALISKQSQANLEIATWEELHNVQKQNEQSISRCVGLSIETRPDEITPEIVYNLRRLGATKTQIGFQSLNDQVLEKNHRGHDVQTTRNAVNLLRQAGFKIQAHWMPNLYGSDPEKDKQDYLKMFADGDFMPDELKVYPCSLIETAELMSYYQAGLWQPYTPQQLLDVLTFCLSHTPPYTRLSRVIRDISSDDIVIGNKTTNFRELAQREIQTKNLPLIDIRAREIKDQNFKTENLHLIDYIYQTSVSTEHFLQFVIEQTCSCHPVYPVPLSNKENRELDSGSTKTMRSHKCLEKSLKCIRLTNKEIHKYNHSKLAAFLRLSLPHESSSRKHERRSAPNGADRSDCYPGPPTHRDQTNENNLYNLLPELQNAAIIRELHVYGPAARVGEHEKSKTQHRGLGHQLIKQAIQITKAKGYPKLAVISAVGTREYYRKQGFQDNKLYQYHRVYPDFPILKQKFI